MVSCASMSVYGRVLVWLVGKLKDCFLSCLCGSEPSQGTFVIKASFLSCLCGSERFHGKPLATFKVSKLPVRQ